MKFVTIGRVRPENMTAAYARWQQGLDVPQGVTIEAQRFEADGHRFFVFHDSNSATAMAQLSRAWEDICEFETVPVLMPDELDATLT